MASELLEYMGKPLRRKDNIIYYGSMDEPYIIMLQIRETKDVNGLQVASRVAVQLQHTDPTYRGRSVVEKSSEKESLTEALELGAIWLDRYVNQR